MGDKILKWLTFHFYVLVLNQKTSFVALETGFKALKMALEMSFEALKISFGAL
jgi:hypothetical protein